MLQGVYEKYSKIGGVWTAAAAKQVGSGESFGLVVSNHNLTFGGLLQIKDEPDEDQKLEGLINNREEEMDVAMVLRDLNIDPALLNQPESGHDIPYQSTIHPSSSSPPSLLALLNSTPPLSSAASSGLSTFDTVIYSLTADSSRDNPEDGTPGRLEMKVPVSNVVIDLTQESEEGTSLKRKQTALETVAGLGPPAKKMRTYAQVTQQNEQNTTNEAVPDNLIKHLGSSSGPALSFKAPLGLSQDKPASPSLTLLSSPLPVIAPLCNQHRPQSLQLNSDIEFYTFMDLRFEQGWATYNMNSRKYVEATDLYNNQLVQANEAKGIKLTIKKRPRAIADKLALIEAMCSQRIIAGNYAYGVKTQDKNNSPPKWPQPEGIFTDGTHFHPFAFLEHLRRLYEKAIVEGDITYENMESEAFFEMLKARLDTMDIEEDGKTLKMPVFRLYSYLTMSPPLEQLVMTRDGKRYLRVDCLREN
ncbi:hypothetical protein EW026_g2009 [Hermanssonia centrifuga]|uniref:Uncharacterized protein n=1 Tax=Hermanssonia centrifuga TaxID=98765 RepID=A0A4S4KPL5_9APHY|nr:hypothetical protein EW026_g2009 [Hermanssonia centrifuga]